MIAQPLPGSQGSVGSPPKHRKLVLLPEHALGEGTAGCTLAVTLLLDYAHPTTRHSILCSCTHAIALQPDEVHSACSIVIALCILHSIPSVHMWHLIAWQGKEHLLGALVGDYLIAARCGAC